MLPKEDHMVRVSLLSWRKQLAHNYVGVKSKRDQSSSHNDHVDNNIDVQSLDFSVQSFANKMALCTNLHPLQLFSEGLTVLLHRQNFQIKCFSKPSNLYH